MTSVSLSSQIAAEPPKRMPKTSETTSGACRCSITASCRSRGVEPGAPDARGRAVVLRDGDLSVVEREVEYQGRRRARGDRRQMRLLAPAAEVVGRRRPRA